MSCRCRRHQWATCAIVFVAVSHAQERAKPSGIPGFTFGATDDPRRFNWDKPDLITWTFNDNPYKEPTSVADEAQIVYRSREWACRVTPTHRRTWAVDGQRTYEERRGIECKMSTGQTAAVFVTCRYRPSAGEFDAGEADLHIGNSADVEWQHMRWLHLKCFVGGEVTGPLKIRHS